MGENQPQILPQLPQTVPQPAQPAPVQPVQQPQPTFQQPVQAPVGPQPQAINAQVLQQQRTGFQSTTDPYSTANLTGTIVKSPVQTEGTQLFDQFMNSPELIKARQDRIALENAQRAKMGEIDPMATITGEAAMKQDQINALRGYEEALQQQAGQRYSIAQGERAQLQDLMLKTGGKAGIKAGDSFESASKKAGEYMQEQATKQQYSDMYTKIFGAPPESEMSSKKIQSALSKEAKKNRAVQEQLQRIEMMNKTRIASGGGAKSQKIDYGREFSQVITSPDVRIGSDGYVNTVDFLSKARSFIAEGGTWQDILKSGANYYLNPDDATVPRFLKTVKDSKSTDKFQQYATQNPNSV